MTNKPRFGRRSAEEHGRQIDDDLVQRTAVEATTITATPTPTLPSPATTTARATALSTPAVTKMTGASSPDQPATLTPLGSLATAVWINEPKENTATTQ